MKKIKVDISEKNQNKLNIIALVYAALLSVSQEQAQEFLDRITLEDDLEPYEGIGHHTVLDICIEFNVVLIFEL